MFGFEFGTSSICPMVGQDEPHFHKQLMMPREVEKKKEIVAKAERWNERGGLHSQRHNDIQPDE